MNLRQAGRCVVALGLIVVMFSRAHAQGVYHIQRLFIVPVPGKVVVDGDLNDWDLSGSIYTYVIEATAALQSARTAMMYDAEALYICPRVADPTPLFNRDSMTSHQ